MSAVLKDQPRFGRMAASDLEEVVAIERAVYSHPWTRGNFVDSLNAGYHCCTYRIGHDLAGYFILIVAVGESHPLNLSVAAEQHSQGLGSALLREAMRLARWDEATRMFLEVRPSNAPGIALYEHFGFKQIAKRRGYYPAHVGREDALVLSLEL